MPRFYFHLHEKAGLIKDEVGQELPNAGAAYDAALLEARSIIADEVLEGQLDLSSFLEVWDGDGVVFTLPFEAAIDLRSDLHRSDRTSAV